MIFLTYALLISDDCQDQIRKHCKKNSVLEQAISKKVNQILSDSYHFKPLRAPLSNKRRVHILGCFVLIYEIEENSKSVILLRFAHHDDAY